MKRGALFALLTLIGCSRSSVSVPPAASSSAVTNEPAATSASVPANPEIRPVSHDLRTRIARDLEQRTERTPASELPSKTASGTWQSPAGNPLEQVYVVSWSRPPEQDGVPTTAFFEPALSRYWLHEGGGISGQNDWYGPFPLPRP